jgi:hypothetical protein
MVTCYHVVKSIIYKSHATMQGYNLSFDNVIMDAV